MVVLFNVYQKWQRKCASGSLDNAFFFFLHGVSLPALLQLSLERQDAVTQKPSAHNRQIRQLSSLSLRAPIF